MLQNLPTSADRYGRSQRSSIQEAVKAVRRIWRRMTPDFDTSFARIQAQLYMAVTAGQREVAVEAEEYIPAVLEETGQLAAIDPAAAVSWVPLIGFAGDGRPLESLLHGAVTRAKKNVGSGQSPVQALDGSRKWLSTAVGTVLSDTGRAAEKLELAVRPVGGFVRMLNPPSCSRCALLAGRVYRSSTMFLRHPGCDCRHIPASESLGEGLLVDPNAYFDSLDVADQDRIFTKAGAEAIRAGADVGQVVNARRGMAPAQGRILTTSEGTSRRGFARRALGSRRTRLMPETIQRLASDKDEYLRLLRSNGYLV